MRELYRFVKDSLDCHQVLIHGDDIILAEGSQQGDPLRGLKYCESIQLILLEKKAGTMMAFVNDINLEGKVSSIARDVQSIIDSNPTTGLVLNASKCEIMAKNFQMINKFSIFKDLKELLLRTGHYWVHQSLKEEQLTML